MMRSRAVTETFDLWEDEPDPMRLLLATAEFIQDRRVDQVLGRDKPLEVEAVCWRFRKRPMHRKLPFCLERFQRRGPAP